MLRCCSDLVCRVPRGPVLCDVAEVHLVIQLPGSEICSKGMWGLGNAQQQGVCSSAGRHLWSESLKRVVVRAEVSIAPVVKCVSASENLVGDALRRSLYYPVGWQCA